MPKHLSAIAEIPNATSNKPSAPAENKRQIKKSLSAQTESQN
jgi:hypothetical protein